MPNFTFTSPEGKRYVITGPEGSTQEQAYQMLQTQLKSGAPPMTPDEAPAPDPDEGKPASWSNPADVAIGSGQALGTGIVNLIPNAINAAADIVSPGSKPIPTMSPGQTATDLGHAAANSSVGQWVSQKIKDLQTHFNSSTGGGSATFGGDLGRNELRVTNDLMTALPVVGGLKNILLGGAKDAAESAIVPPTPSESFKAGYRSAADHPIAAGAAGQSGIDALTLHNQQIGNVRIGNAAGVAQGDQLSAQSLQKGAEAPNTVFNRAANALPTIPLSPENTAAVNGVGVNDLATHTPDAQAILADNKQRLTSGPLTGDQAIDNLRALRQEGYARIGGPAADVEQQNLGKAQLKMADILENHIGDNLPKNGDVSLDQFQDARTALAQNHAVGASLQGNNIDLQALARMQNASPNLLTGELRVAADFANAHPAVSGLANHIEVPPSMQNDVGEALNSARSHDVIGRMLQATGVAAKARKVLTGDTAATVAAARAELPQSNAARFAPLQPKPPEPGNWSLGVGAGTPDPQAPLGDFASVLSHGVEQPGPAGLSSGPMGTPNSGGLTFQAPPESVGAQVVHGGAPPLRRVVDDYGNLHWLDGNEPDRIQMGDRFAGPVAGPVAANAQPSDYAGVASQGVPENIAQRATQLPDVTHEVDEDTGAHTVRSANGETHAQESGPFLISKRSDTAETAEGKGEATARAESLVQQAEARGLRSASDISVTPGMQGVYAKLKRRGYVVLQNPDATVNSATGNLVSDDPRKPVFIVKSQLSQALQ
jgi:hypothetical protein